MNDCEHVRPSIKLDLLVSVTCVYRRVLSHAALILLQFDAVWLSNCLSHGCDDFVCPVSCESPAKASSSKAKSKLSFDEKAAEGSSTSNGKSAADSTANGTTGEGEIQRYAIH